MSNKTIERLTYLCVQEGTKETMEYLMAAIIQQQLKASPHESIWADPRGNQSEAARRLGINRGTLRKYMRVDCTEFLAALEGIDVTV